MNKSQAILTVLLATTEAEPLPVHVVTARVLSQWPGAADVLHGWGTHSCGRSLSQMYARGRISRVKTKAVTGYRYYLTEEQRVRCFAPVVYPHAAAMGGGAPALVIGPVPEIVKRIRFLERLKSLPAFAGEAVVDVMLGDYTKVHAATVMAEEAEQAVMDAALKQAKLDHRRAGEVARKARSREKLRGEARSGAAQHEIV